MLQIQKYYRAESLEQAYQELIKNRNNQIIAGMLWLKMQDRLIPCAIDLSQCQIDQIEETEHEFKIGAMCTLRQLETHASLNAFFDDILKKSVQDIVGVQFRNMATVGGSIYSRFGFSDLLCALLCLDCDVVCYKKGTIPLKEYIHQEYERDILTHVILHKKKVKTAFACVRKSSTDFSILNVSASLNQEKIRLCIGARPQKAEMLEFDPSLNLNQVMQEVEQHFSFWDNMRASQRYRKHLCKGLVSQVMNELKGAQE